MTTATPGQVQRGPELDGLGDVVASLLEDNLAEHPERWHLVSGWSVQVRVVDADSVFAIVTTPSSVLVTPSADGAVTLSVEIDGDTLVGLPEIPLVAGLPDLRSAPGRALVGQILRREVRIKRLVRGLAALRRLLRLLNTAG